MEEIEEIRKELKKLLRKAKYKVYTTLNHVSSSGMFRRISCFVVIKNEPLNINWYIDKIGIFKRDKKKDGLRVSGVGMDMGFHIVYTLGSVLWKTKEEALKENIVTGRNGSKEPEINGGYLLKQEWL